MKIDLDKEGFIVVTAETIVEAHALNNVIPTQSNCGSCGGLDIKIMVDCGILNSDKEE